MGNYIEYNIDDFIYDNESNVLSADEEDLYYIQRNQKIVFPNGKKKFIIKNKITGNIRKFVFKTEDKINYVFISQIENKKPIICLIKKLIFVW